MLGLRPSQKEKIVSPEPKLEEDSQGLLARAGKLKGKDSIGKIISDPKHEITETLMSLKNEYGTYKDLFYHLSHAVSQTDSLPAEYPELKKLQEEGHDDALIYAVARELANIEQSSARTH